MFTLSRASYNTAKQMPKGVSLHSICLRGFVIVALAFLQASCAGETVKSLNNVSATNNAAQTSQAILSGQRDDYKLGSGDKIKLIVYNEEDLSGEFDVSGNGM